MKEYVVNVVRWLTSITNAKHKKMRQKKLKKKKSSRSVSGRNHAQMRWNGGRPLLHFVLCGFCTYLRTCPVCQYTICYSQRAHVLPILYICKGFPSWCRGQCTHFAHRKHTGCEMWSGSGSSSSSKKRMTSKICSVFFSFLSVFFLLLANWGLFIKNLIALTN